MSDDSVTRRSELPPLRIHHLLIWSTLSAVIISASMGFDRWARNGPPIKNEIVIAGLVLAAVVVAGALTIVGCGLYWRRSGIVFPRSPGDWLLTIIAGSAAGLCLALVGLLIAFLIIGDDDWFAVYYLLFGLVALSAWIFAHAAVINHRTETFAWRFALVSLMLSPLAALQFELIRPVVIAVIACILGAACVDWNKNIQRRWTHWYGVACAVFIGISLLCMTSV